MTSPASRSAGVCRDGDALTLLQSRVLNLLDQYSSEHSCKILAAGVTSREKIVRLVHVHRGRYPAL